MTQRTPATTEPTEEVTTMPNDPLRAVADESDDFDNFDNFDPYDTDAMRQSPPDEAATESVLLGLTVRKPKKDEFIRVNPDPDYIIDTYVLEYEGGNGMKDDYLIPAHPKLRAVCEQVGGQAMKPVRFFLCINKWGALFLWGARLPAGGRPNRWHTTALAAADEAMAQWVRVQADMNIGMYRIERALADIGDPTWPEATLAELLRLAFTDEFTITSPNHAVLRELQGFDA